MKPILLLIFVGCCLVGQEAPQPAASAINIKAAVLEADAAYRSAVLHGDGVKLATMFSDEVLIVHSDGTTDTKNNFVDAISSGRLKLTSYERKDARVFVYGSIAIMFARTAKSFAYKGSPGKAMDTSTITFSRSGERWTIVAMQNTPLAE